MSLRQKAARGVVWSVLQRWGRGVIATVTFVILSRLLAPEAFGLVALATVFTAFVELFLDQGFGAAIVQRSDLDREHLDTGFWISLGSGLVLTGAGIAGSGLLAAFFKEPELVPVLRWLSLTFVLSSLSSTQIAILQRKLAFRSLAARSFAASLLGGVVGVSLAFAGYGVWSLVAQNLSRGVAGVIVLWRSSDWRPRFKFSAKHFRDLFGFGSSIVGIKIAEYLSRRSGDFLIGYFLGTTMLGYYVVGYRLVLVMIRLFTGITNSVAAPTFSRLQHQPERLRRAFVEVTQYTSLLTLPVFIGLAALAPELIPALSGEIWAPSIPVMQILTLGGVLQSVLVFNGSVLKASGKPSWQLGITLLASLCNVIGFLLVVRWGIEAIAISFVVVQYLMAPLSYVAVRRLIRIETGTYLRQFVPPVSGCLVMVGCIVGMKHLLAHQGLNSYVSLSLYMVAGGVSYALVIMLTARPLSRQVLQVVTLGLPRWKLRRVG